jgi:hypothetical protein
MKIDKILNSAVVATFKYFAVCFSNRVTSYDTTVGLFLLEAPQPIRLTSEPQSLKTVPLPLHTDNCALKKFRMFLPELRPVGQITRDHDTLTRIKFQFNERSKHSHCT